MGPAGLLRLATIVTLGLSLLLGGCATGSSDAPQAAAEDKSGWARCPRTPGAPLTVVCLSR
jgi:hypothetical protein